MKYKFVVTKNAAKQISKLPPLLQKRIKHKLEFYLALPDPLTNAKTLENRKSGDYRWRIGNYRVIFDIKGNEIVILQVQHRRDIYRK